MTRAETLWRVCGIPLAYQSWLGYRFKNLQKFPETIYARVAERVLGSLPASTPDGRVHAHHRLQPRQLEGPPSTDLALISLD
jgi:hypothetical protein